MSRKLIFAGVLYLASVASAGVLDIRNEDSSKGKEPEKKPNILKEYICLRDGELCHPDFGRNRGLYVSCSNGVAWEQQCPKCSYHPLNCPTRTLWFDGEKCEWASPKLASQPCIDRFPGFELNNNTEKDAQYVENVFSEQESLLQSLQVAPMSGLVGGHHQGALMKEPVDQNKWQMNPMSVAVPMYFQKSTKYEDAEEPTVEIDANGDSEQKDVKAVTVNESAEDVANEEDSKIERKSASGEESESEFPSYLSAEDTQFGSKIVRLNDPVYALVNNPDGSGKQVLMRISQPFVLEDQAGNALRSINVVSSAFEKE